MQHDTRWNFKIPETNHAWRQREVRCGHVVYVRDYEIIRLTSKKHTLANENALHVPTALSWVVSTFNTAAHAER